MKIRFVKCLAVAFAMLFGSAAMAQDYYELDDTPCETVSYLGGGDGCQKACDDDCGKGGKGGCCSGIMDGIGERIGGGGAYVDVELLLFKPDLGISDGAQYTVPDPYTPKFAYEAAPRISVGYVGCGGLGVRFRYFDYSHDTGGLNDVYPNPGGSSVLVDTYTMDAEFFEELEVGCSTSVEWSAGVRYLDFKRRNIGVIGGTPTAPQVIIGQRQFSGWGLTFGLKAERCLGPGRIYGRARWAIQQDDHSTHSVYQGPVVNDPQPQSRETIFDDKVMQTEIALGYEVSRCTSFGILTARIGYEIQYWEGFRNLAGPNVPNIQNAVQYHRQNAGIDGFDGLVLGIELAR